MDTETATLWRIAVHEAGHAVVMFALGHAPGELGILQDRQSAGFMGKTAKTSDEDEAAVYAGGQVAEYLYCERQDTQAYNATVAQLMASLPETLPHTSPDSPSICPDERGIELLACHRFKLNPLQLSDDDKRVIWQFTVEATCCAMEILEQNERAIHYLAAVLMQQRRVSKDQAHTICTTFARGGRLKDSHSGAFGSY